MKDELLSAEEWTRVFDELGVLKFENLNRSMILTSSAIERLASNPELQSILNRLQLDVNDSITLTIVESEIHGPPILHLEGEAEQAVFCAIAVAPHAPKWAGCLLTVFAKSPSAAEAAVGCMHERFVRDCARYGVRHAKFYCWAETVRSLWPLFRRAVGRAVKWAAIFSTVKRFFVG